MLHPPTVIVLAAHAATDRPASLVNGVVGLDALEITLRKVLASGLPPLLVAPAALAERARQLLPGKDVLTLDDSGLSPSQWTAHAVAAGVQASAKASAWLILPANMPTMKTDTLRKVAQALTQHTMVYPQYRLTRGHPLGCSAELYSELIRLQSERDLSRLVSRYPAAAIEVDDAGVLMGEHGLPPSPPLRAHSDGVQAW